MWNLVSGLQPPFLRLSSLFIGSKQTLEALEIPKKSYFNLLVKL
jgi:hypothetical protein